jgi:hypothetical protein
MGEICVHGNAAYKFMSMQDCSVGRKGYDSEVKKLRYEQDRFDSTGLSNCRWVLVLSCVLASIPSRISG